MSQINLRPLKQMRDEQEKMILATREVIHAMAIQQNRTYDNLVEKLKLEDVYEENLLWDFLFNSDEQISFHDYAAKFNRII